MKKLSLVGGFACLLLAAGCSSESAHSGAQEPLRVNGAQFFPGEFPPDVGGPKNSLDSLLERGIPVGYTGKKFGGRSGDEAYSIALRLADIGTGYWVLPVTGRDPQTNELVWSATVDFSRDIPAGTHLIQAAAADGSGRFGTASTVELLMSPLVPTGAVVASLEWGNDADLDLHITTPSGKEIDPKHPNSTFLDSDKLPLPGNGVLDRDSNAGCVIDGYRTESVVWPVDATEPPEAGTYGVRVDLFSACGRPSTNFVFKLYQDGQVTVQKTGRLLDIQADGGGAGSGLFVTEFSL
jgi:hypothetical protein